MCGGSGVIGQIALLPAVEVLYQEIENRQPLLKIMAQVVKENFMKVSRATITVAQVFFQTYLVLLVDIISSYILRARHAMI